MSPRYYNPGMGPGRADMWVDESIYRALGSPGWEMSTGPEPSSSAMGAFEFLRGGLVGVPTPTPGGLIDQLGGLIGNLVPTGGGGEQTGSIGTAGIRAGVQAISSSATLRKILSTVYSMLINGASVASAIQYVMSITTATEPVAQEVVARAIRTRGGRRRMNPLNPYALRRAITRINRFDKFADKTEKVLRKYARRK